MANALTFGKPRTGFTLLQTPSYINFALSSTGHKVAFIITPDRDDTITHVGFRGGVQTGSSPIYRVGIQAVSATGTPSGGGTGFVTFAGWNANSWNKLELSAPFNAQGGTPYAVVIEFDSGTTPSGSNNRSFTYHATEFGPIADSTNQYSLTNSGAGWTKFTNRGRLAPCALYSANHVYGNIHYLNGIDLATLNGQRRALKFTFDENWFETATLLGANINFRQSGETAILFGVWDEDGNVLASNTYDKDHFGSTSDNTLARLVFDDPIELQSGVPYFIGIERVGGGIGLVYQNLFDADGMDSPPGVNWEYALGFGSSWSVQAAKRPEVELILDEITAPAGGGGGSSGGSRILYYGSF